MLEVELAPTRGNRTRDAAIARAGAQTTRHISKTIREQRKQENCFTRRHSESASIRMTISADREQDKLARRQSESASTRAISAEGSPRSRQFRTTARALRLYLRDQREIIDTRIKNKLFTGSKTKYLAWGCQNAVVYIIFGQQRAHFTAPAEKSTLSNTSAVREGHFGSSSSKITHKRSSINESSIG